MLNRRSLRVKVMQSLFAFEQCIGANYHLGLAEINEAFLPNLNSMKAPDHDLLEQNKKQAQAVLANKVLGTDLPEVEEISKEAQAAANKAHKSYHNRYKKDYDHLARGMVLDAESLVDRFLEVISLLLSWADCSRREADKKSKISPDRMLVGDYNLHKNALINFFRDSSKVQVVLVKRNPGRENDEDHVKTWYKDILKKDEAFDKYRRTANPNFKKDKEIIDYLVKQVVFKDEMILSVFEEKDIFWQENKAIVRSLVTRSIRDLEKVSDPKAFELPDFSNNWDEDRLFFEEMFKATVENDREYSEMIAAKTRNWEVNRLAITDQVILKMAIAELLNFHSIPVKVTINEYIELSKNYSTPKSKQFVNGILDAISEDLRGEGRLKKSGRGLLDNK